MLDSNITRKDRVDHQVLPDIDMLRRMTRLDITERCWPRDGRIPEINTNPNKYDIFLGEDRRLYHISVKYTFGNCYSTAMGWMLNAPDECWYMPGFTCGEKSTDISKYTGLIMDDLEAVGRHVYTIIQGNCIPQKLPPAENGRYWIKTMKSDAEGFAGFHIARKDETSGRWIHRFGHNARPSVFMRNLQIDYRYKAASDEQAKDIPMHISLWEYETDDNASYMAYLPQLSKDGFVEYKPMCAMLID